jgi:hypothetical protein
MDGLHAVEHHRRDAGENGDDQQLIKILPCRRIGAENDVAPAIAQGNGIRTHGTSGRDIARTLFCLVHRPLTT